VAKRDEWWRGAVIYQIYPRSFYDSNGDGIGDLKGITQKLDYVASLGVDGVWLSPFFTSPMKDFGYDVADYKGIDPIFGTLEDCDEMIAEMHKRGLKLVIDIVLNHSSDKHPWFTESRKSRNNPKSDWYVWADPKPDGSPPNNWLSVFGGSAWEFDPERGQYYYHQFLKEQPDLNIRNPAVQDELLAIAKWWLDRGVDGFRMDALPHCIHDGLLRDNPPRPLPPPDGKTVIHPYSMQWHRFDKVQPEMIPFLKKFRALTDKYEDRMLVAEVNDDMTVATTIAYTNGPEMLHTAYDFSLLVHKYSATYIRRKVEEFFSAPHDSWPSWALSNHDSIRVATRWAVDGKPDERQTKMLVALTGSLCGSSFLYQGEELGLTEAAIPPELVQDPGIGSTGVGRDGCRTPMPWQSGVKNAGFTAANDAWLPVPQEHVDKAVSAQEADPASMLNFTRHFLKWRKQHAPLMLGGMHFQTLHDDAVAFTREWEEKTFLCVFNLRPETLTIKLKKDWTPVEGYGLEAILTGQTLELPPFGVFYGERKTDGSARDFHAAINETPRLLLREKLGHKMADPKVQGDTAIVYAVAADLDKATKRVGDAARVVAFDPEKDLKKFGKPDAPHGLLYLPHPYLVPGGRFNEMYGWDTSFAVFAWSNAYPQMMREQVDNQLYQIRAYGKVLNASRTYYLTRSHPPMIAAMVRHVWHTAQTREWKDFDSQGLYADAKDWLAQAYKDLTAYYHYWTTGERVAPGTRLSRYWDDSSEPAAEVVVGEVGHYEHSLEHFRTNPDPRFYDEKTQTLTPQYYQSDRSMRASGFDPTGHWGYGGLECTNHAPACLNSLLYRMEGDMAEIASLLGNQIDAGNWKTLQAERKTEMQQLLMDPVTGVFQDYNFAEKKRNTKPFANMFHAFWAGLYDGDEELAARAMHTALTLLETPHGIVTSNEMSGCQWDYPYGWPPLQFFAFEGLKRVGRLDEAKRVAGNFLSLARTIFGEYGGLFEKYNTREGSPEVHVVLGYSMNVSEQGTFLWTAATLKMALEHL